MAVTPIRPESQAAECERAMLGALLIDAPRVWPIVSDLVSTEHIDRADHRIIFATIGDLMASVGKADAHLLIDTLGANLEAVGGTEYIADLYESVASCANARAYALQVREAADKRKLAAINAVATDKLARGESPIDVAEFQRAAIEQYARNLPAAPPPPPPERRPMRWTELQAKAPPEREWKIAHWLTGGPTLMAGVGGVGKTLLAQTISTGLALGRPFLDRISTPSTVLMWACEDEHDELWRRQAAVCRYFDVPMSDLEEQFILEPRLGRDNALFTQVYGAPAWTPLLHELTEQVKDYGAKTLFIDNIAQTYGGKENDRHHVTAFLNGLAGISPGLAVVIMGHPAKATDSEFSGSTAWENAVRMRWYMGYKLPDQEMAEGETPDPSVRYLAKRKANYSEKDYRKFQFHDGLFKPEYTGPAAGPPLSTAERAEATSTCILVALRRFGEQGIRTTDGRNSSDYLPRKMREMKLDNAWTQKELGDALAQLRLNGKVSEGVVGIYANRSKKTGLFIP
jgi:RecA-family ATPase